MPPYVRLHIRLLPHTSHNFETQICEAIASEISGGNLPQGSRLPPVRVLAHQLGISKNTVQFAYDELAARGLVVPKNRQGVFVSETFMTARSEEKPKVQVPAPSLIPRPMPNSKMHSQDTILLSNVFVDPDLLPNEQLNECFRSVLKSTGLPSFYDTQGFYPLREWIAERLSQRGISATAEEVIITTGSQQALDIACRALQHKHIATENPAYHIGKILFEMNQMQLVGLPIHPFKGLDLSLWEKRLAQARPSLLYLTPNFQNPTGYSYSSQELRKIAEMAERYQFGILEDDWGADMLSFSEYRPSLRALCGDNVLYLNSFTKKLLPSLRVGYLVGNRQMVPSLVAAKRVATLGHPSLIEEALFEFLSRGYYDTHLQKLQTALDRRYHHCLQILEQVMPDEVAWTTPGGSPILWLELPPSIDLPSLIATMQSQRINITDTRSSFFGTPHLHGIKIGFAYNKEGALEHALQTLANTLKQELAR